MECNKDEAARAKQLAEEKFTAKDIIGAKKFALKAQNLFPGLEGISQMLATLDVYAAAENKINGEVDWYGILGVDPRADEETVRKHYRKLALTLHPDKNKSIGADGAFKFISQAWSLLSDKSKRTIFDQKRNSRVNNVSTSKGNSSSQPEKKGFYNFTKSTTTNVKGQKSATRASHSSIPSQKPKPNTFWTVCHRCKMQYEYLRVYLNHTLLCPNCHEPFLAVETPPPPLNGVRSNGWDFTRPSHPTGSKTAYSQRKSNTNISYMGASELNHSGTHCQSDFQWGPFSKTAGVSSAAQAATVVQQAYEKVKRQREEAQAAKKEERKKHRVSKKANGASGMGHSGAVKKRKGIDDMRDVNNQSKLGMDKTRLANESGCTQGNTGTGSINRNIALSSSQGVYLSEMRNLLMEKAKREISKRLCELNSTTVAAVALKEGKWSDQITGKRETTQKSCNRLDEGMEIELLNKKNEEQSRNAFHGHSGGNQVGTIKTISVDVPEPDFHNFDRDRTESSFRRNQVWAAYDNDDGMPRYYAWIHSVLSLNPFKIQISWLYSQTISEHGLLTWVSSGFSRTCGDYRIGRREVYSSINSFSHKVSWSKGTSGDIHIYPRKGDVWALYRNWSPDWNELTPDEVRHKYDMVEVLEDYSEEVGVIITPLVKVAGFKAVFHQHLDPQQVRSIPKHEIFRFSHLVPSHLLTGQEAPNAPRDCLELDPAATPVDLLHVVETEKGEESMSNEDINAENSMDKVKDIKDEKMEEKSTEVTEDNIMQPIAVEVAENIRELKLVKKTRDTNKMEIS